MVVQLQLPTGIMYRLASEGAQFPSAEPARPMQQQRSQVSVGHPQQGQLVASASAVRAAADQALLPLSAGLECRQLHKDPAASAPPLSSQALVEVPLPVITVLALQRVVRLDSEASPPQNGATSKARNTILHARRSKNMHIRKIATKGSDRRWKTVSVSIGSIQFLNLRTSF